MASHDWSEALLVVAGLLFVSWQRLRIKRERAKLTLRHALVASHLFGSRDPVATR